MKHISRTLNLRLVMFVFCAFFLAGQFLKVSFLSSSSSSSAPPPQQSGVPQANLPADVYNAVKALPNARVELLGQDGIPSFVAGDLGRIQVTPDQITEKELLPALQKIAPVFRLRAQDLSLNRIQKDDLGFVHIRYRQTKNGLSVVGGDFIVHINPKGIVHAVNGKARDGFDLSATPAITGKAAAAAALGARQGQTATAGQPRLTYLISSQQNMHLTYEISVEGVDAKGAPVRDLVYVDANDGKVVDINPQVLDALNRQVYTARSGGVNQCIHPGTLVRSEGGFSSADPVVNTVYEYMKNVYDTYHDLFGRDSWDGSGGSMISTVHHCSIPGVAARWETDNQAIFMDTGSGSYSDCLDIVGHEFTHGVSIHSGLGTGREAGALNEAWSDIFGAVVEIHTRPNNSSGWWIIGEDCAPPGIHFMSNPTQDGSSVDNYDELLDTNPAGPDGGNVHNNAGIANLAFYLLVNGGVHPRIPSGSVPALGIGPAQQIFYRATTAGYLIGDATFADARIATVQAATDLNSSYVAAVNATWDAVKVTTTRPLDSTFISQSVPTVLVAGESTNVSITFRNSGSQTWLATELATFFLKSEPTSTTWGTCCSDLPHNVLPGDNVTFNFTITAPSTPGTYGFQWRMFKTSIAGFGQFTPNVNIKVVSAPTFNDNAIFVSQSVPTLMDPGQTYVVSVVMKNTGSTIWTTSGGYSLGSQNPDNNTTWGINHVSMPSNIPGGSNANFSFFVTAPTSPGTYNFQWRMAKGFAAWFGNASTNVVVTINNGPTAPTNLAATIVSNSQVNLSWNDTSSNETGFKIERRIGTTGTFTQIATVGANVTSFSNTGLTPLTTYCYRVRSYNANGNSAFSNEVCVTMPDQPPAAPTGFSAAFADCTIGMSWTDNSNDETGFIIEKRVGSFGPFTEFTRVDADQPAAADPGPFQQSTYYFYRVRAYNAAGVSAPSNQSQVLWFFSCN